jgi:DNA gyrase/topoisomerase IV subunit A
MKKNNLVPNKGLSLSQAQSISNLCYQRATEIGTKLSVVNNFSKTITIGEETKILKKAIKLPDDVVNLLKEKATLHACQAFLMENIKAKENLLSTIKKVVANVSEIDYPESPDYVEPLILTNVDENFGWEQLSAAEINEYLEAEAFASHIGLFIHKDCHLDRLRAELPNIPEIEWFEVETGKKTPVIVEIHHTAEGLLKIHEELAALHREYEQKVNFYKAKVKNLTTAENARIAKENADEQTEAEKTNKVLRAEYETIYKNAQEEIRTIRSNFEKERQANIAEIAIMRIDVDPRFQKIIDVFLKKLPESQE